MMSAGEAFSFISYNWMLAQFQDEKVSKLKDKVQLVPVPGESGLAGGWGWAIAANTPKKDAAWEFIKWVESPAVVKARALAGGAPTRYDVLRDAEVLAKYPYYNEVEEILEKARPVPEFEYSSQMVEMLGRELSLIVSSGKDPKAALAQLEKDFNELAKKANLQK
jgi:ABC-type glycerol-3-phosphate transport system substrate-binding protein